MSDDELQLQGWQAARAGMPIQIAMGEAWIRGWKLWRGTQKGKETMIAFMDFDDFGLDVEFEGQRGRYAAGSFSGRVGFEIDKNRDLYIDSIDLEVFDYFADDKTKPFKIIQLSPGTPLFKMLAESLDNVMFREMLDVWQAAHPEKREPSYADENRTHPGSL